MKIRLDKYFDPIFMYCPPTLHTFKHKNLDSLIACRLKISFAKVVEHTGSFAPNSFHIDLIIRCDTIAILVVNC